MGEWIANPLANTTLKEILPCVSMNVSHSVLDQTTQLVNDTIRGINKGIETNFINGSTSSPILPLCNPSFSKSSSLSLVAHGVNCVNISTAAQVSFEHYCVLELGIMCPMKIF